MEFSSEEIVDQMHFLIGESANYLQLTVINAYDLVKVMTSDMLLKIQNETSNWTDMYPEVQQFTHQHLNLMMIAAFIVLLCVTSCWCFRKGNLIANQPTNSWNVFDLSKTAYLPGHTETVINLVEKFTYDVNYVMPSSGLSLFLCACLSGENQLITYLLKKGADVHVRTKDGDSALYLATYGILNSQQEDISVLEKLIKAGCGVNTSNYKGYTPLHRAASKGSINVLRCLLKHGADPYVCSKAGVYPIDSAINAGHLDAAELLKIDIVNPHVWDLVDPHTPPRIQLGLQSPVKRHLLESSKPRTFSKVLA